MKVKGNMNKFYYSGFPMQAVLVTCDDENGQTNVITIAWHTTISKKPPLYGISVAPGRYSHKLIENSKEFAINFMPYELIDKVHFCGTHSGRNTDKIKETGLTLVDSEKIKTKIIKEGFAHFECKLFDKISLGDHTLFVGEIVNLLNEKKAFTDDLLENKKVKPVYYLGNDIYTSIDEKRDGF
jgi:flavin reductase (DIM6/NTAB) family NADH-FMN oxidoreductase RutF